MKAYFQKRILEFTKVAGTSRGVLLQKPSWYIFLYDEQSPEIKGIGEVSIIPGLSFDNEDEIEGMLTNVCAKINAGLYNFRRTLPDFPAISFGVETALKDYKVKGSKILFPSDFTEGISGIKTNGLIWMGNQEEMLEQVKIKLESGFRCLKIKIGAIDFNQELLVLRSLRQQFKVNELEIRVDANGAFSYSEAKEKLKLLQELDIHSIEQPILPNQIEEMADLCQNTDLPVALDEELIGKYPYEVKKKLIDIIRPQYLILKPSLLGGINESTDWIKICKEYDIDWWVTSALESNIGLNVIAQWVATLGNEMYQGLGLGSLYKKNIDSPLELQGEKLFYNPGRKWSYEFVY